MCGGGTQVIVLALLVGTHVFGRRRSLVRYPFPLSSLPVCSNTALLGGSCKEQWFPDHRHTCAFLLLCVTSSTQCKRSVKLQRIHFAIFAKWL